MLEEEKAVDQSQASGTEGEAPDTSAAATETAGATTDDNGQTAQQGNQPTPEGQEDFIGETPKELEPFKKEILTKFYAKTRELAKERQTIEQIKKDAETLENLKAYKPFQDWYNNHKNGTPTQPEALSEEYLEQLRTDPAKFNDFITKKLDTLVEQKYGAKIKTVEEKAEDMRVAKEFEETKATYGEEFEFLHKSGELDAYYDKGLDFETAFAKYKLKTGGKTMNKPDPKTVDKAKQAASEKPSSGPSKAPQQRTIKPKGFDDAFDAMFAAAIKGEKVKIEK